MRERPPRLLDACAFILFYRGKRWCWCIVITFDEALFGQITGAYKDPYRLLCCSS